MSSAVAELDGMLQSMLSLKPPGVNQNNVKAMQALCTANIQSETVLIQKLYTSFKKAPGNYKLGVLYVVDSVTRLWIEQARKPGQPSGADAVDGTFASGVNHVTDLMPAIMTDIINTAPKDQKGKIQKLVDIWERGKTFPEPMLRSFKGKFQANDEANVSTTPDGSPSTSSNQTNAIPQPPAAAPPSDPSAILQALANMAKGTTAGSVQPAQGDVSNVANNQNILPSPVPPNVIQNQSAVAQGQTHGGVGTLNGVNGFPGPNRMPNIPFAQQQNAGTPAPAPPSLNGISPQQIQLLQFLQAQNVPPEQWLPLLGALSQGTAPVPPLPGANAQGQPAWQANQSFAGMNGQSRDQGGVHSPANRARYRSRSRSPSNFERRRDASPHRRRRDSPVYGEYNANADRDENRNDGGRFRRGRDQVNGFGRNSPSIGAGSATPPRQNQELPPPGPRYIKHDPSLEPNRIKVLSRTLFVGGVTSTDNHIRNIFSNYGKVQTCIVNVDKRHAFVKMLTRDDAVAAKDGMERYKSDDMQLRTRWGVGFGPRECSDYATGISIISIERLTDADRKWMLTAPYGGTGGEPIKGGMVVEEPDIEIGAGVSSKAISRRMVNESGGVGSGGGGGGGGWQNRRSVGNPNFDQQSRFRQPDRGFDRDGPSSSRQNNQGANEQGFPSAGPPPPVPGFGFPLPQLPNGMPMFPPGFMMPGNGAPGPS